MSGKLSTEISAGAVLTLEFSPRCCARRRPRRKIMETLHAVSRRDFLRAGGVVVVSFASGAVLPRLAGAQGSAPTTDMGKPLDANEVDSFLAIHATGSVTLYTSRVDVGTCLKTAMSQ